MSPGRAIRILMVEDSPEDAELEARELRKGGIDFVLNRVETLTDLDAGLREWKPDLVLSDFALPDLDGLQVLERVRRVDAGVPFIFVSGTLGEERAIEAMKAGATDYVLKDRLGGLGARVKHALQESGERARLRKLEEDLRQAQKLDALGRLAGGVAHDFNNLLTAVLSFSDLALGKLEPSHAARADLEQILQAGEAASNLTRQLLAFSRNAPMELRPVDVNAVIETMRPLLSRLLGADVAVEIRTDPSAGPAMADVGGLEQILLNLCMNSRDAMPSGGKILIETTRPPPPGPRTDGKAPPRPTMSIRVTDSGSGIEPEILPRIFEPFFTTKAPGRGAGFGLSTVYGIVQVFKGSIAVVSESGKGTTFWIRLPEAPADVPGSTLAVERPRFFPGAETVLVAEDSDPIRKLVGQVLSSQGYRVVEAVDGADALAQFDRLAGQVDLLLTDLVMPNLGGKALVEELRKRRPGLKVVLMSGVSDSPGEISASPEEGMLTLGKPFTPLRLSEAVRKALDPEPAE